MGWFTAIVAGALVLGIAANRRRPFRSRPPADAPTDVVDPVAPGDQLELLRRYGTADDAARLIAEGRGDELAGLGYRTDV